MTPSQQEFYAQLSQCLKTQFPKTFQMIQEGHLRGQWDHLISPNQVLISEQSFKKMKDSIRELFSVSRTVDTPSNFSILMSYDFHTSESGDAKLIEINTNASGYLISCLGLATHNKSQVQDLEEIQNLKKSIETEYKLSQPQNNEPLKIAIVDDHLSEQKMLIEFHLYKELFESWGWSTEILEASELLIKNGRATSPKGDVFNFIYNRSTDFYLKEDSHKNLFSIWKDQLATVSPQPMEYQLLADKKRLLDWQKSKDELHPDIQNVLLNSFELQDFENAEALWKQRKKFFFKPKNSFGGKSAYRGQSIGHKVFDRMMEADPIIQEYFPPQKSNEWKFDIRCYVYQDELQLLTARLYQGQVTNFSTLFGGFSPVRLKS